jgi:hypothetical protein
MMQGDMPPFEESFGSAETILAPNIPSPDKREDSDPSSAPRSEERRSIQELINDATPEDFQLEVIGRGGEHVVLENRIERENGSVKGRAEKVVKVNFLRTIVEKQGANIFTVEGRRALTAQLEEARENRLTQRRLLRSYFGFHAMPAEKAFVEEVPMTPALYDELRPGYVQEKTEVPPSVPALITIQRRVELGQGQKESVADLADYYAELPTKTRREKRISAREYERGHDLLIGNPYESDKPWGMTPGEEQKEQREIVMAMYPSMRRVKELQEKDPKFREQVRNFARNLVQYANASGMKEEAGKRPSESGRERNPILDFVGEYNVVMARGEAENWRPLLLDAVYGGSFDTIENLERAALDATKDPKASSIYRGVALNALHYIRYVNALATMTGIEGRVQVPKAVKEVPAWKWREFIRQIIEDEKSGSEKGSAKEKTEPSRPVQSSPDQKATVPPPRPKKPIDPFFL